MDVESKVFSYIIDYTENIYAAISDIPRGFMQADLDDIFYIKTQRTASFRMIRPMPILVFRFKTKFYQSFRWFP